MAQLLDVSSLKPHPENTYYFDDISITPERWQEFLDSVRARGIITPITISNNSVIVSGHQRVKACQELGIAQIPCEVRMYSNEDELLQDLIETNIRQRGTIGNPIKMGRCAKTLMRLYGIEDMGKSEGKEAREKIAAMFGKHKGTLYTAKRLTTLNENIQAALDSGAIPTNAGTFIAAKFDEMQEEQLAAALPAIPVWQKKQVEAFLYLLQTDPEKVQTLQQSDYKGLEELLASPTLNAADESIPNEVETLRAELAAKEEALKKQAMEFDQERAMAARGLERAVQRAYKMEEKAAQLLPGSDNTELLKQIQSLELGQREQYERAEQLKRQVSRLTAQLQQESQPNNGLPSVTQLDELSFSTFIVAAIDSLEKYHPLLENANPNLQSKYANWLLELSEAIDDAYKLCDPVQMKQAG